VFDRRPSQFARAASKIFRSLKTASGSPTGEPALDLTTQHSVIRPPLPAALVDLDQSPSTRRRYSSRISCDRRTSSANGAFGRHERHESEGMRLVTAASGWRSSVRKSIALIVR